MLNEKQIFTAEKLCLSGTYLLRHHDVKKVCNGIGPEWFPPWLRLLINTLCPALILVAQIHDMRYHLGGSCSDRRAADAEFMANALIIAEAKAFNAMPQSSRTATLLPLPLIARRIINVAKAPTQLPSNKPNSE